MIGLDTNVLLRLLLDDHRGQNATVKHELETAALAGSAILVNDIVLAETVWTLARTYGTAKTELLAALHALVETATFQFESRARMLQALELFEDAGADFADCLIVAKNTALGCTTTLTFDKGMRALPGVRILNSP